MNVTLLADIAGRPTQASFDADRITAASVCIAKGATKSLRQQLTRFPKWSEASDSHVDFIVELLRRRVFAVSAISLAKTPSAWDLFWKEAEETHKRISNLAVGSIGILKAATMIKFALYGQCSMLALSHAVKVGKFPFPQRRSQTLHVRASHIYDKEMDGPEIFPAFKEIWDETNLCQPLVCTMGIKFETVSAIQTTEQAEPLLMLADYAAGIAHAAHSVANTLKSSSVTLSCARRSHELLRAALTYTEIAEDFNLRYYDIYPSFAPGQGMLLADFATAKLQRNYGV